MNGLIIDWIILISLISYISFDIIYIYLYSLNLSQIWSKHFSNDIKVNVYSAGTTALIFAADTVLIPFFQYTNLNSAAAVPNVQELLALPDANVYYN